MVDYIFMVCAYTNATDGNIFVREFYDPFLFLYCEQTAFINQFMIRQNQLIFQRELPLYRFQTRARQSSIYIGYSFIFIGVDLVLNVFPQPASCCVLRIDPCEFTVSAIVEIIMAQDILTVTKYEDVDVALLQSRTLRQGSFEYECIIKAYFPHIWITLNQTNSSL